MEEFKIETIVANSNEELVDKLSNASEPDWKFTAILGNDGEIYEILFKR